MTDLEGLKQGGLFFLSHKPEFFSEVSEFGFEVFDNGGIRVLQLLQNENVVELKGILG